MYQTIDGTLAISVNDWCSAGLTYDQFRMDSQRNYLSIFRRGINGNTLIDVRSIKRPERLRVIEGVFGKIEKEGAKSIFTVELDTDARDFFVRYRRDDGSPLEAEQITKYQNRASIFEGLRRGLMKQQAARARAGKRMKMGEFWVLAADWYLEQMKAFPCDPIGNVRVLERTFKRYLNEGYESLIHQNIGNDAARLVSVKTENLLLALWRTYDKPFVKRVHELYLEFVSGTREFHDKETGEVYHPEDFRYKDGRAIEISEATVWNYLKDVINETSVYMDRNGWFDYNTKRRPKQKRKLGKCSLSKITMDDSAISRKSTRGWVYRYIAVDVVSGYWFRPAYVVGKPNHNTVIEAFRNMFCELNELGLSMPGELEVERFLMKDLDWLNELFPFVRFATSPTEKRAEHAIKVFKYGVSKDNGHTRGRWYAGHEAYRSVRNKVKGDYTEPLCQPQAIIADDLSDIVQHNNTLHPLQKTYPGMTRREVFLSQQNPDLKPIEHWHLYRYIGNETQTTIYNNDYCPIQEEKFELTDFNSLKRLKPNNCTVTAYWLPEADGSIGKAHLYQGDTYIGEAVNSTQFQYNENKIEQTDDDRASILHQNKRNAKFDKLIRDRRLELPKLGSMAAVEMATLEALSVEVVETEQPLGYEEDEFSEYEKIDWTKRGELAV